MGKDVCSKTDDEEKCVQDTSIFSIMINFENCHKYDQEQYSHCTCVASEDAPSKRQEILTKFYKKFSSDSLDKVEGLAKKSRHYSQNGQSDGKACQEILSKNDSEDQRSATRN